MRQDPSPAARQIEADEVEALVAEILARPEYLPAEPPVFLRWLHSVLGWIDRQLTAVFRRLAPDLGWDSPAMEVVGRVLLGLCALVALVLIGYLLFLGVRSFQRRRRRSRTRDSAPARPPTAADWETAAAAAAARQEWRRAAMALYQAVLLRLAAAGAVRLDRSKTPGDYRRDIGAGDRDLAARFDAFRRRFERVAFGPGAPGEDQYVRLAESAAAVSDRG